MKGRKKAKAGVSGFGVKKERTISGISINVILLGIASLITDVSSEMILPLLPLFIVSLGGTAVAVGLIAGISDGFANLLQIFSGYWSDKIGKRKPFVVSGYLLSAFGKLLYFVSFSWLHVFVVRTIDRIGKGLRSAPRDAMIANFTLPKLRGKAFGLHRAMDTTGAVIGSALALVFFWYFGLDFKTIFLIAAVIAFTSLVPLWLVKDSEKKKPAKLEINFRTLPREFKLFLIVVALFYLGNLNYMFFMLKAQEVFKINPQTAILLVLALYIWYNAIYVLLSMPFGILSDKIGRKKVIVSGYLLFAIVGIGFSQASSVIAMVLLFAAYGIVSAMIEGNHRAFAADLVGEKYRGTALGAFHTVVGLSTKPDRPEDFLLAP